jgi:hypothetical protein
MTPADEPVDRDAVGPDRQAQAISDEVEDPPDGTRIGQAGSVDFVQPAKQRREPRLVNVDQRERRSRVDLPQVVE